MKKKTVLISIATVVIVCLLIGSIAMIVKTNQKKAEKEFKAYNETLVYDIYNFSPEITNNEKRASLKTRMDAQLMDQMCPPLPELNRDPNLPVNTLLNVKTETMTNKKEEIVADTRFVIKTPNGKEYPQKVRAEYKKNDNKWILMKIQPIN